jgi:hypothetical protein
VPPCDEPSGGRLVSLGEHPRGFVVCGLCSTVKGSESQNHEILGQEGEVGFAIAKSGGGMSCWVTAVGYAEVWGLELCGCSAAGDIHPSGAP